MLLASRSREKGHKVPFDDKDCQKKDKEAGNARVNIGQLEAQEEAALVNSTDDTGIRGSPVLFPHVRILTSPVTWLPPLAYLTTFGLELTIDANLANILFVLFNKKRRGFNQTQAGYYTSIL